MSGLQFNLRAANVSATALNAMLNPLAVKHPWYRLLARNSPQTPYLLRARASGRIAIDRLVLGKSVCNQFTAELGLEKGKVTLGNIRGEILDGRVNGEWKADFAARPPAYSGTGGFDGVSLFQIADLTHDSWIDGKGTASYKFKASGWRFQDLLDSADLSATFTIKDSNFPHIVLTSTSAPLHASMFSGTVFLRDGNFSFQDTKLDTATGVYKVSGTASLTGALNLKMNGETANGYSLSGTLVKTRVSQITPSATQALLKP